MTLATQLTLLGLTQLVLVALVLVARRRGGAIALLLMSQAVFWTLGFVLRPAFMILVRPTEPELLADVRLAVTDYGVPATEAMALVLLGLVSYLMGVYFFFGRRRSRRVIVSNLAGSPSLFSTQLLVAGVVLWGLGWIGRGAVLTGAGGLLQQLQPMAVTGSVLLIIATTGRLGQRTLLGIVLVTEIVWSFSFESKAALILPILALLLRWVLRDRVTTLLRFAPLLAVGVAVGFFGIQSVRGILTGSDVTAIQGAVGGGVAIAYLVGLLQRFDGFSSVTDAVYLNGTEWQTTAQYFERIATNMLPKFGAAQDATNGQLWTREVRAYSVRTQYLDVPIAAGPTAEGYAMWGVLGIVALNLVMAALIVLLGRGINSVNPLAVVFSISMTFNTGFFEIALQGWAGQFNKSLQATVVALPLILVVWLVSSRGKARRVQKSAPPRDVFLSS